LNVPPLEGLGVCVHVPAAYVVTKVEDFVAFWDWPTATQLVALGQLTPQRWVSLPARFGLGSMVHAPAVYLVRQVIDLREARAAWMLIVAGKRHEVDVVDRYAAEEVAQTRDVAARPEAPRVADPLDDDRLVDPGR
jgi:hypothetical protein